MIEEKKCSECYLRFEVMWDDNIDALGDMYESDEHEPDLDLEEQEVLFCPFCGAEVVK